MSVIPNGSGIKKLNVNGVNMKEAYANGVKVFSGSGNIFPDMPWVGTGAYAGVVTSNSLKVALPLNTGKTNSVCRTSSKVNLTNYSKIIFIVRDFVSGNGQFSVGIDNDTDTHIHDSYYKYVKVTGNGTYTLDVSSITGSYYVAISIWNSWSDGQTFTVTSVTGE